MKLGSLVAAYLSEEGYVYGIVMSLGSAGYLTIKVTAFRAKGAKMRRLRDSYAVRTHKSRVRLSTQVARYV